MNAALGNPSADDALLYDLDPLLSGRSLDLLGETPVAPYRLQPTSWSEGRCPACGQRYSGRVAVCPVDASRLDPVLVSHPFLWLG